MQVPLSNKPGRHERHFKRKLDNKLMPSPIPVDYSKEDLLEVQRLDHEELLKFLTALRATVQKTVELQPREESQILLDLKAELEKLYETACSVADEQGSNKEAILQLIEVIMENIKQGTGGDTLAAQELAQEAAARNIHFQLLEYNLIADILHPESLIAADELAAVLLTDPEHEVMEVLTLFEPAQRMAICHEAESILEQRGILKEDVPRMNLLCSRAV